MVFLFSSVSSVISVFSVLAPDGFTTHWFAGTQRLVFVLLEVIEMRLPTWKFKNTETNDREDGARRLHEAAWPDMFANLQSAYAELTNAQFELERRTAEISETRDLFQQVISSMSEALFLTDRSGRVIRANPAAAALLECQETSILGRPLTAVCGSDEIPATSWKLMEIAPTGRITNLDADLHTLDGGTIPVSFSLS